MVIHYPARVALLADIRTLAVVRVIIVGHYNWFASQQLSVRVDSDMRTTGHSYCQNSTPSGLLGQHANELEHCLD
jgi:hypothetical protein